jgi:hypothetical protein
MPFSALDSNLVNVIGYLTSSAELFGVDFTRRAFLISEDSGQTWLSVNPQRYRSLCPAGSSDCIFAQSVPWKWDSTNLPSDVSSASSYTFAAWKGINFSLTNVTGASLNVCVCPAASEFTVLLFTVLHLL